MGLKKLSVSVAILSFGLLGMSEKGWAQTYQSGYHTDHHHHVVPSSTVHHGTYYSHRGNYYYDEHPHDPSDPHGRHPRRTYRPRPVQFGGFSHVDDLALRLETLMNDLCLDMHYNYQHNQDFAETYAEAYQILETARYIHDAEHASDRNAIAEQLGGMDAEFHHIEDDVRGWHRHHHRQVGHLGIITKMELIEATIHHLMNDVGVKASSQSESAPEPGFIE